MEIVLYQPEIAGNVGAIIRLAANTGIPLHIIETEVIKYDEVKIKRAGLDYHDIANVTKHSNWGEFNLEHLTLNTLITTSKAKTIYWEKNLLNADYIIFGPESVGLPDNIINEFKENMITIPMDSQSRSINLANAVSIITYEYLRQREAK